MPNKVYIKVTQQMVGDPNIIATLEKEGGINKLGLQGINPDCIYYIDSEGIIRASTRSLIEERLANDGYHEIQPDEYAHTIHLKKGDTSLLVPLKVPDGFEAVVNGEVVTEVKVELRKKRWKPSVDDKFYTVGISRYGVEVYDAIWGSSAFDDDAFSCHNVFETQDEAESFAKVLKQHYWQAVEEYETT